MFAIPQFNPLTNAPNNIVHGKKFFTGVEQLLTVPDGVYLLWVSLVDSGANGIIGVASSGGAGGASGAWALYVPIQVTPGMVILCHPGTGSGDPSVFGNFSITKTAGAPGSPGVVAAQTAPVTAAPGGTGAPSFWGAGGAGGAAGANLGNPGNGFGSGGGGGGTDGAGGGAGGTGAPGAILVEW